MSSISITINNPSPDPITLPLSWNEVEVPGSGSKTFVASAERVEDALEDLIELEKDGSINLTVEPSSDLNGLGDDVYRVRNFRPDIEPISGGLYECEGTGSQTITGSASGGDIVVNQWREAMPSDERVDVNTSTGVMTLNAPGTYKMSFHVSFETNGGNDDPQFFRIRGLLNGSVIEGMCTRVTFHSALGVYSTSVPGRLINVSAGDEVSLQVQHDSTGDFTFDLKHGTFLAERVGI